MKILQIEERENVKTENERENHFEERENEIG